MENPVGKDVIDSKDLGRYKGFLECEILNMYIEFIENHNAYRDEDTEELEIPVYFEDI